MADKETKPTPKNILQKVQTIRKELSETGIKKSGKNTHTKASYHELGDFLPDVNKLCEKHGVTPHFRIPPKGSRPQEVAVLTLFNNEDPSDKMTWVTETATVSVQGGQAIQNLGAKHTYMRRYMYMEAFEISESDAVDANEPAGELDQVDIDKIHATNDMEHLIKICKNLKKEKPKLNQAIVAEYNRKKADLEAEGDA